MTLFLVILGGLAWLSSLFSLKMNWLNLILDFFSRFTTVFLGIFIEAVPFLLMGTLASGLVEVYFRREDFVKSIPRQTILAVVLSSLVGIVFPVCECGVVPFMRRLVRKGLPYSAGVAVLLAVPVINPVVIASTYAAFGHGVVFWGRIGITLVVAIFTGLVFSLQKNPDWIFREGVLAVDQAESSPSAFPLTTQKRLTNALIIAADEFVEMGQFLVLGALLAAGLQTVIPQAVFQGSLQHPAISPIITSFLAVLLSICSTVDAFIALSFTGVFPSGSILAFLVFGPMVDIKSTLMYLKVFKGKAVFFLIVIPLSLIIMVSIAINYLGWGY